MSPILALTLHPEWAWAITHLGKNVENRSERFCRHKKRAGRILDGREWSEVPNG